MFRRHVREEGATLPKGSGAETLAPGMRFHYLTTTGRSEVRQRGNGVRASFQECICICGGNKWATANHLRQGLVKSCGCARKAAQIKRHATWRRSNKLFSGMKFGNLTTISEERVESRQSVITCRCKCGSEFTCGSTGLRNGRQTSCGDRKCRTNVLHRDAVATNHLYASYRGTANRRELSFELSIERFGQLILSPCFYCGEPHGNTFSMSRKAIASTTFLYNGIDRLDSTLGYSESNCVSCCGICNTCKMDLPFREFISRVHLIALRHKVPDKEQQC